MPGLGLLAFFQVLRRAMNYALSRPAREVLFTVLRREDKYKAKSFMDTLVYRAGDQIGAWSDGGQSRLFTLRFINQGNPTLTPPLTDETLSPYHRRGGEKNRAIVQARMNRTETEPTP